MSDLKRIQLPPFGQAEEPPLLPVQVHENRLRQLLQRMAEEKLEILAVYGDREHFANLACLTGFDPRFEEALLLLDADGRRKLLVGNECMGYLPDPALGIEVELFQEFSLLGQPRGDSRPLRRILADFGVRHGTRLGAVGWKYFAGPLVEGGELALDLPAYLADLLRELCGDRNHVVNATAMLMGEDGLRLVNEPEQIAAFEYAATVTSDGVLALLRHLEAGEREDDLERHLDARGLPLTCHRMVSFGAKVQRGLSSACSRRAILGDPFTVAFGVNGALTCRAGCVARGPEDLSPELRKFFPAFAENYFDVITTWYESLKLGVTGGDVFAAVDAVRNPALYKFAVNPGHYIHLDEWVNAPFSAACPVTLKSGMALQADIIPVSQGIFCYINAEDGVVLADAALRAELSTSYPEMWHRICLRRAFMQDALGIRLDESVLPLGNTPGWLAPYILNFDHVLTGNARG